MVTQVVVSESLVVLLVVPDESGVLLLVVVSEAVVAAVDGSLAHLHGSSSSTLSAERLSSGVEHVPGRTLDGDAVSPSSLPRERRVVPSGGRLVVSHLLAVGPERRAVSGRVGDVDGGRSERVVEPGKVAADGMAEEGGSSLAEEDVVNPEIEDGGEALSERDERAHGSDKDTGHGVVGVMELVDRQRAGDEDRAEEGGEEGNLLPVRRPVVGHNLELGVQVEREEHESSGGGGRVSRGEGLESTGK